MTSFLEKIAERLLSKFPNGMEDISIVLPNQRSILFLKHYLSKKIKQPIFLPSFFSIENFLEHLSGLQVVESISLQFQLYQSYLAFPTSKADSFDDFLKWSDILLQDFNDIDRNLIDPKIIFSNLQNVKELENWDVEDWSFSEEKLSLEQNNFLSFYQKIYKWYTHFNNELLVQGIAYQGMAYKAARVNINSFSIPWKKIWFVGLNDLSKSEEEIIDYLKQEDIARIFWDADEFYYNNPIHEAGSFLRKQSKKWQEIDFKGVSKYFSKNKDNFRIIACPKNVAQAKVTGQILNQFQEKELQEHNTAVVLANEGLLFPLLYQIPSKINKINITMGSPLKNAPIFGFFDILFNMQIHAKNSKKTTFYYKDVISFLESPYSLQLIDSQELFDFKKFIFSNNKVFITTKDFQQYLPKYLIPIFTIWKKPLDAIESCKMLIQTLRKSIVTKKASVESEMLYQLSRSFLLIEKNLNEYDFPIELKTIYSLLKEIVAKQKVVFSGEPLNGLQIMGILETRALDFKNVIIAGLNEGHLPKGRSEQSFIPFDLKRYFNIPTYFEKDAVSSYHFYRLLQRAKDITLIYNTETDDFGSGEKSRFITQLEREYNIGEINSYIYQGKPLGAIEDQKILVKNKNLKPLINQWAEHKVSPSALSRYVNCSLSFYFFYLAKIYKDDEVEEFTDSSTFGNIIHKALYKHYPKGTITLKNLKNAKSKILKCIEKEFQAKFTSSNLNEGKNYLMLQIALSLTESFLQKEEELIKETVRKSASLKIIDKEKKVELFRTINKQKFRLYGKIDRVDQLNELIRIVDYKTGKVESGELNFKTWKELIENPKKSKAFQLLMYAYLYLNDSTTSVDRKIVAGNFSFKNNKKGLLSVSNSIGSKKKERMLMDPDSLIDFEKQLDDLLTRIMSEDFKQTEDQNRCKWCEYKKICNR